MVRDRFKVMERRLFAMTNIGAALTLIFGLATLVIHTAGTRLNAVAVRGLGVAEAERLRDALARVTADDDDA